MFKEITIQNLLSFGPDNGPLPLENLNVLIGPNGSGKSNLLDAIALMRSAPNEKSSDIRNTIAKGGGIGEWIWKGAPAAAGSVELVVDYPDQPYVLRHCIALRHLNQSISLEDETIECEYPDFGHAENQFFYRYQNGKPTVKMADQLRKLKNLRFDQSLSVLSQLRDPSTYPELAYITKKYNDIAMYREWLFGRKDTPFRRSAPPDLSAHALDEDFTNLPHFLNEIITSPSVKNKLKESLQDLYEGLTDFGVKIKGGSIQVYFNEDEHVIPATRLSEGSVRYLCLLAALCDPNPPSLLVFEEPEIGLHPDILPKLAELLVEASQRTQLIVTTHSDVLVDALSDHPSSVVVCEKSDGTTSMRRLNSEELAPWLEKYRLGELWTRGEIGGTRW